MQIRTQVYCFVLFLAILLTLLLRETGPKVRKANEAPPIGAGLPAE